MKNKLIKFLTGSIAIYGMFSFLEWNFLWYEWHIISRGLYIISLFSLIKNSSEHE